MNYLLTVLLLAVIGAGLCFKGITMDKLKQKYLLLFFAIFIFDQLISLLPKILPFINVIGGQYNWTGKIMAIIFSIIFILVLKRRYQLDFAFTLKQLPKSVISTLGILFGLILIQFSCFYFTSSRRMITWEDHLFQSSLPGLSEEIMFRGILLGLLNGVFLNKNKILGAYLGWGTVVTTVLFALWHGLRIEKDFHLQINYLSMLSPFFVGLVCAWIRERTKSILIPVIYHNLTNELLMIIPLIK